MASSEATFRATIEPFIVPSLVGEGSENPFTHRYLNLAVSNEGLGPALDVRHICFRDDEALSNFGHFIELPIPAMAFSIGKIRSKESVGGTGYIRFGMPIEGERLLIVFIYRDLANTVHQCQFKYERTSAAYEHQTVIYCRKQSPFPISQYGYPKKKMKDVTRLVS